MAGERIVVIEDEEDVLELIRYNLSKAGYQVEGAATGEQGLELVRSYSPQLVVLDLMLPGVDGLEICRLLRADPATAGVGIVMVTARDEEPDIVTGLELGADDYITKPFSPRVLLARVKAVLRRRLEPSAPVEKPIVFGELTIDPQRHKVTLSDRELNLTSTEFAILKFLASRPGWVFTRSQIIAAVHGEDYPVMERSVDVQIAALRKKLGEMGGYIETVRGVGYRFREG